MNARLTRLGFVYLTAMLLVAQLILVAGHVHLDKLFGTAELLSSQQDAQQGEHQPGVPGDEHHICTLCLAQAANVTPVLPAAPDFEQPCLRTMEQCRPAANVLCTPTPQRIFQPRAPPLVS